MEKPSGISGSLNLLPLLCFEKKQAVCALFMSEVRISHSPLPVPLIFKPAKGLILPVCQTEGWVPNMWLEPLTLRRILSLVQVLGTDSFSFLPGQLNVDLSYSLRCITVFLPVSSLFSRELLHFVYAFSMCSWGEVSGPPSYSTI